MAAEQHTPANESMQVPQCDKLCAVLHQDAAAPVQEDATVDILPLNEFG